MQLCAKCSKRSERVKSESMSYLLNKKKNINAQLIKRILYNKEAAFILIKS